MAWTEPLSKDPDVILKMSFIPPHLLYYIPKDRKPGTCSPSQYKAIRRMLNMRAGAQFNRCRGRSKRKREAFEAKGNFMHSESGHVCSECRCGRKCGEGTKGDFYGLGVETGTLGVGYCANCLRSNKIRARDAIQIARREVEMMQKYGEVRDDKEYAIQETQAEIEVAEQRTKLLKEMQLVEDSLEEFKKLVDDPNSNPTEMANGTSVPMADKTRFMLSLEFAKTIAKLRESALKTDPTDTIKYDHLLLLIPELQKAVMRAVRLTEELTVAKCVRGEETEAGSKPVADYVWDVFSNDWKLIWARLRNKVGNR